MAEITQAPELRYTSDNQTPIAEMMVQFPGLRPEDPSATLKVIAWRDLAQEVSQEFHQGDRVVIEGRLGMITVDRPEGFKEKRAELTMQRIHRLGTDTALVAPAIAANSTSASKPAAMPQSIPAQSSVAPTAKTAPAKFDVTPAPVAEPNFDEIPF